MQIQPQNLDEDKDWELGSLPEILPTEVEHDGPVRYSWRQLHEGDDISDKAVDDGCWLAIPVLQDRPIRMVGAEEDGKGIHQRQSAGPTHVIHILNYPPNLQSPRVNHTATPHCLFLDDTFTAPVSPGAQLVS